jgi:Homing endonuclease associated repeat/HNH endonuclease
VRFEVRRTARGFTDDELLRDLRAVAEKLGRKTVTIAEYSEHGAGHAATIQRRFGSWFSALERAGLAPSRSPISIADEQLFQNLRAVWITLGRQPSYGDVKKPVSTYSAATYDNRFGGWSNALRAFVGWANSDQPEPLDAVDSSNPVDAQPAVRSTHRTRREISDRVRFSILMRDGFACGTCGVSPASERGITLHVDHVIPWSRGGETVPENLATKCSRCNLGKGAAFEA